MNPQSKLILNHFTNRHSIGSFRSMLNMIHQNLEFPVSTVYYDKKQITEMPFRTGSFDFIACKDQPFKNPFAMVNECMRLATKGGVILIASPLQTLILDTPNPYVVWPDRYSNALCIIPHHKVFIPNRTQWMDLIRYNPIYLNCFYHWSDPMDINIKTFIDQDEEIYEDDYTKFMTQVLHDSVSHTQEFLTQYQN